MARNDLYDLIASLSKAEKRYFRMHSGNFTEDNDYMNLFDSYQKIKGTEKNIDEIIIKKSKIRNIERRLPNLKNYLYQAILKNLNLKHAENSIDSEIETNISYINILLAKRLHSQAQKNIKRTKKLAAKYHRNLALARLEKLECSVKIETHDPKKYREEIAKHNKNFEHHLKEYQTSSKFEFAYFEMLAINRKIKFARSEAEKAEFDSVINSKFFKSTKVNNNPMAQFYAYMVRIMNTFGSGNYLECKKLSEELLALVKNNSYFITEQPRLYFSSLVNALVSMIHTSDYANYFEALDQLRDLGEKNNDLAMRSAVSAAIYEMVYYLDTGNFESGITIAPRISEIIDTYDNKITDQEKIILYYNMAYLYFGSEEYSNSLKYVNILLNEYKDKLRFDIHCAARIFALLLYYEMGKISLLDVTVKASKRYLKRKEKSFKLEQIIMNFMVSNIHVLKSEQKKIDKFKKLRKEFEKLQEDPYEKPAFDNFHYFSWVDSKIYNTPFQENVKKEFHSKQNRALS